MDELHEGQEHGEGQEQVWRVIPAMGWGPLLGTGKAGWPAYLVARYLGTQATLPVSQAIWYLRFLRHLDSITSRATEQHSY